MVEKAATIWADGPSSAPDQPSKPLIREWGTWLEGFISAIGENVGTIFETKAQMDAALAYDANTMAWVVGDSAVANNGVYRKTGGSGSGSWTRVADLPYSYVTVVDDGTSTANAMSMETETTVPTGRGTLIAIKVPLTNTSSTVTISFNGSTAIPVKTASGGLPPVGTLIQNMVCLGFVNDVASVFQLMTDVASAAIQTAAAASATLAGKWATEAEDVPVTGSLYSAYHWAQKAAASQSTNASNLTTGTVPDARLPARLQSGSSLSIANQAEAEAGTENTKAMTPLLVKQAISALASGGGINIVTFTSSGSYVPSPKLKWAEITVIGGGGGWGNYNSSNVGGAGGGTAVKKVKAADLAASNAVVIGAGGALNTNGGNSSITLPGGAVTGGGGGSGYSAGYISTGGIGSGGDRNFKGSNGTSGVVGASSFDLNVTDLAAANWGYGHGGSSANAAKAGVVIIEEHF